MRTQILFLLRLLLLWLGAFSIQTLATDSYPTRCTLILAAQQGDEDSFATYLLEEKVRGRLRSFFKKRVEDPNDIDDLVQQTVIRFWRYLPKINLEELEKKRFALLFQMANRAYLDFMRVRYRRERQHTPILEHRDDPSIATLDSNPAQQAENNEFHTLFLSFIATLAPPRRKEIAIRRLVRGQTNPEIAEEMELDNPQIAANEMHEIKKRLLAFLFSDPDAQ